jgi:hypothetical protein
MLADVLAPPSVTVQTQRDLHKMQQRMNKNRVMYPRMNTHLEGIPKDILLKMANKISVMKEIPPADRICRRNRSALVCWFCESYLEMLSPQLMLTPNVHPEPGSTPRLPFPPIGDLVRDLPISSKMPFE